MFKETLSHTAELMKKSIDKLKQEFASLRTSRANITLVDGIKVNCYDTVMPLNQVAGISIPDAKTIEIRPCRVLRAQALDLCYPYLDTQSSFSDL